MLCIIFPFLNSNMSVISHDKHSDIPESSEYQLYYENSNQDVNSSSGLFLTWKDVHYTATINKKPKHILKGISGFANPGEILAIMGSSGSGKTSLLSILSNQIIPQRSIQISGKVEVNQVDIKTFDFSSYARYVMQQDILMPTLTVKEALIFAATLKIKGSKQFIEEKVNALMLDLKLKKIEDSIIGNAAIKGISGGEKKRVCIGIELISEPQILILDEPTSGLDSFTAELVIDLLKSQAKKGKTIVLTIHQPSSSIYKSFDRLILLVEGNTIYQGAAQDSVKYFTSLGYECPESTNPPDYYMRIMHIINRHNLTDDEIKKLDLFYSSYKTIEKSALSEIKSIGPLTLNTDKKASKAGFILEFKTLSKRAFLNSMRNPMLFGITLMQFIVNAALIDILFRDLGHDTSAVQSRQGVLYFSVIVLIMFGVQANAVTLPVERPQFLKDYKEGLYGVTSYFLSKMVSEFPAQVISVFLFTIIEYFAVNFNRNSASNYFVYLGVAILTNLVGTAYGNLAGVISKDVVAATIYSQTIAAPLMLFGGFFSNANSLSKSFYWIKYLSAFYYAFEALCINEFTGLKLNSDVTTHPLDQLGFPGEVWTSVGSLLLLELGCVVLTLIVLKYIGESHKNR